MSNTCPVCSSQLKEKNEYPGGRDVTYFSCPLCGDFTLSRNLIVTLPNTQQDNKDASAKISHALRTMQQVNKGAELYTTTVKEILKRPLPSPREQADLFIRWLADNVDGPGETVWVEPGTHSAIIGAKSPEGFDLVLRHLFDVGLVTGNYFETLREPGRAHVTLSFKGWDHWEQLRQGGATYRKAFMAMEFGDPDLDYILEEVFKPSVRQTGFELFRLDDVPQAGLIDDRFP